MSSHKFIDMERKKILIFLLLCVIGIAGVALYGANANETAGTWKIAGIGLVAIAVVGIFIWWLLNLPDEDIYVKDNTGFGSRSNSRGSKEIRY